ncbi:MAG: site-2 protease family protein [Microgenomates group bacterium]
MTIFLFIFAFLFSLAIHEAAHAWMADRQGDPTARLMGRLTLNPFAHLDPLGALLPLILLFLGSPIIFGWGKPVPVDPFNLRHPRRDSALISLAGPMANIILGIFLALIIRISFLFFGASGFLIESALFPIITLNITWAVFNLLPLHPLDGGKVLVGFLSPELAYKVDDFLSRYGQIILLFLIFPFLGTPPLILIISPIVKAILSLLLPGTPLI